MFLFIFESIGTSELLLVGIIALIFLGPRRMPEMAKKAAKLMAEFRGTANEFKETWQREANFEEEAKMLDISAIENETVPRLDAKPGAASDALSVPDAPSITEVDPAKFAELEKAAKRAENAPPPAAADPNDKQNWL